MMYGSGILGVHNLNSVSESAKDQEWVEGFECDDIEDLQCEACEDEPEEAFLRIALESTQNWCNIIETIALEEIAVMEATGHPHVYTEAETANVFQTFKAWLQRTWERIQSAFKKLYQRVKEAQLDNEKFLKKHEEEIKKLSASYDLAKEINIYDFTVLLKGDNNGIGGSMIAYIMNDASSKFKDLIDVCAKIDTVSREELEKVIGDYNYNKDKIWKEIRENRIGDAKDYTDYFYGGGQKSVKTIKVSDYVQKLKDSKDLYKAATNTYNSIKSSLNSELRAINAIEKKYRKANDGGARLSAIRSYTNMVNTKISEASKINSSYIKAIFACNSQAKRIINIAIAGGKKGDKGSSVQHNSAFLSSLANLELI